MKKYSAENSGEKSTRRIRREYECLSFIFIISKHRCSLDAAPFGRSLRFNFFQFLVYFPEKIVLFCEFLFDKFVFLPKIDKDS